MTFPNWLSVYAFPTTTVDDMPNQPYSILSISTVLSFYPQIRYLWLRKNSSGISPYYILFNLIAATEQFTIVFFLLVNNSLGNETFIHTPPTTGDWLNLSQMTFSYVLFLIVYERLQSDRQVEIIVLTSPDSFVLTLHYLPDSQVHKGVALAIYSIFLLISIIPVLFDVITGGPYDKGAYRNWPLDIFRGFHIIFINPVVTLLIVISFVFQVRRSLQESSPCISVRGLAIQAFVFALLGMSWLLRVRWPTSDTSAYYDSSLVWYRLVGWAAVDHLLFALGQAILCFIVWRYSTNAAQDPVGETEPLLNGR
ncbi:hypothetical protein N7491_009155 [Penicillium cf. griseofulvum]|uniref:Uncharacterized protein n=1 Tax=Penicillium cf. griseofulvum TaxID=2972120 RepID=A0A9W9JPD0_9EURO|nr:hypothetical protein N7472_005248 [Penicillium cf. griseofulvum]KAJ5423939.1 hypothetical protein N7491_009155 [Penicillium cf. griseofulvum]